MTTLPKLKPYKIERRPHGNARLVAKHAKQIGEIAVAWNALHSNLFGLFWTFVAPDNHTLCHGLWHCIQSDKTQLDMLLVAAKSILPEKNKMLANVVWLLKRVEALRPYRNYTVHMAINLKFSKTKDPFIVVPDVISGRRQAVEALEREPTEEVWRRVKGDLWALATYALSMWTEIRVPQSLPDGRLIPSPHRPRLLAVPQTSQRRRAKP